MEILRDEAESEEKKMIENGLMPQVKAAISRFFERKLTAGFGVRIEDQIELWEMYVDTKKEKFGWLMTLLRQIQKIIQIVPDNLDIGVEEENRPQPVQQSSEVNVRMGISPPIIRAEREPKGFVFSPPKWHEDGTCLQSFVIETVNPYFVRGGLDSYENRAKAMFYIFDTEVRREQYLRTFEKYFATLNSETKFWGFVQKVAKVMDPGNVKSVLDYRMQVADPNFMSQGVNETENDFWYRIETAFKMGYPETCESGLSRVQLSRSFVNGLRDRKLFGYLIDNFFKELYETAEIHIVLREIANFRLREKIKNAWGQPITGSRSKEYEVYMIASQEKASRDLGRYLGSANRRNEQRTWQGQSERFEGRGKRPERDDAELLEEIQGELDRLTLERNVENGKLIVPMDQVAPFIKKRPGFKIRNYVANMTEYVALKDAARQIVLARKKDKPSGNAKRDSGLNLKRNQRRYQNQLANRNPRVYNVENVEVEGDETESEGQEDDSSMDETIYAR